MTDAELRAAIDDPALRRRIPAVSLAEGFLRRLEDEQPRLRAMITITGELALAGAQRADDARARGEPLPLDGMPIVVKDVIDVAGVATTNGSRQFGNQVAAEDATAVARLRAAGAVLLGKANLHEVAFGATSQNEAYGHVVNPWDAAIIAGGSSGGSGAAVAADLCVGAIGSDTGGSVRIPASCCGVAGIRPTYGAVPNRGVFPVSWTLDTVGPLARSVDDVSGLLAAMAGFDLDDPRSVEGSFEPPLGGEHISLGKVRIGLPRAFFFDDVDPEVAAAVEAAATTFSELGSTVVDVELPGAAEAVAACGPVIWSDALAVHSERLARSPELFEDGTRRRLALAEGLTAAELALLQQRMFEWQRSVRRAFERVDVLLAPTLRVPPPGSADAETIATTASVVPFTFAFSFARVPALSLPCGFTSKGHPVGLQLVAPRWRDGVLLGVGAAYQRATDWHRRRPGDSLRQAGSIRTTS